MMSRLVKAGRACPTCAGDLDAHCHAPGCMSASQTAYVASLRYLDDQPRRGPGRPLKNSPPVGISRDALAEEFGLGRTLLDEAIKVVEHLRNSGAQETLRQIERGELVIGRVHDEIVRSERRKALLQRVSAPTGGKYDVILADPPWRYDDDGVGRRGAAESHYPTMTLADLIAMRPMLDAISADDGMLVMWATSPLLPEALALIEAWGYDYVSSAVWSKTGRMGMGSIFRIDHEFVLVGRRRDGTAIVDHGVRSVIAAPASGHSAKPDASYDALERLWPDARRIELFARRERVGWTAWGAEAPQRDEEAW